jgi:hypothetical protein
MQRVPTVPSINLTFAAARSQMLHATMAKLTRAPQLKQWQQSYFRSDERISDLAHHRQAEKVRRTS